ncbi:hypothetical protein BJV77DRAFT_778598, partial [Russula vinacea]
RHLYGHRCRLRWQSVFVHRSCHLAAHFRTAHSLNLFLRQEVISLPQRAFSKLLAGVPKRKYRSILGRFVENNGISLKKAGLAVRDRRYILWAMERYRQRDDPSDYAHEAKPKKKIRGHGPAVQFGKRIRSRRHK